MATVARAHTMAARQTKNVNASSRTSKTQSPELRFFVGNAQTAGFGLTLTAASNVIYYSNNFNLEHRVQSEDRCHRIGQKNPVTYIDLVVPDSVDEHIVKALRNKINLAGRSLGEQMREWLKV